MTPDRPIFVMGCPRSGTTLLTLMLHAHSRIAMPPENRFLLSVYRLHGELGDLHEVANRRALADYIVGRRGSWFRDLGLDADETRRAIVDGPPTVGSALGAVYRGYAARFGKARWGDKRPVYFRRVEAIRQMFPEAQFVHLVRDGRDCAASLKRMPWWHADTMQAMALWNEAIDRARWTAGLLPGDAFYELRYEDLVADPRGQLGALCDFLGEAFEPEMLAAHRLAEQQVPARKSWHAGTHGEVTTARIGGYRDQLDGPEIRLAEFVSGHRLRRLGYDAPARRPPPDPWTWTRYLNRTRLLRAKTRRLIAGDRAVAEGAGLIRDLGSSPARV